MTAAAQLDTVPDEVEDIIGWRESWPTAAMAAEGAAQAIIDYLPLKHQIAIDDAFGIVSSRREEFMYSIGVRVGQALSRGVTVDEDEAGRIVTEARQACETRRGAEVDA